MARQKFNNRQLTEKLRELAAKLHTTRLVDGQVELVTAGEKLAEEIFKDALGWTEKTKEPGDVPGTMVEKVVVHKPQAWAKQFIWDRLEGKTPMALPDDKGGLTAADKVEELQKNTINAITEDVIDEGESDGDSTSDPVS
jgi:hypothetical protein